MTDHVPQAPDGVRALRLLSPDPEASRAFYSAVTRRPGTGASQGKAGLRIEGRQDSPARWIVGFGVPRPEVSATACVDLGARVLDGSAELGRVLVADPHGIPFELVTSPGAGAEDPGEGDMVLADVYTRHVDDAVRFYAAAFALDVTVLPDDPVDYAMLSSRGRHLAGVLDMTSFLPPSARDQWMPYFYFCDLDSAIERATSLGAWVVVPTTDSPTGNYAVLKDPQECLFGVWDAGSLRRGQSAGRAEPAGGAG
ncbi:VOC family protein [Streptomyces sp. NPDC056716]|uniref:VOC family protein n=1 Tax=unclassified Streptomyces TaxID=2593676 RepID=UPI003678D094